MAKYSVGQKFKDRENHESVLTIVGIAPELDYDGLQTYFGEICEPISKIGTNGKYFVSYSEHVIDEWYIGITVNKTIVVNGSTMITNADSFTYEDIVSLAMLDPNFKYYTMTYSVKNGEKGILMLGKSVGVVEGMRFNVGYTGNA